MSTNPSALIRHAIERMDDRFVTRARLAGLRWKGHVHEMKDEELVGMFVVTEIELEKRGLLDQEPRRGRLRAP